MSCFEARVSTRSEDVTLMPSRQPSFEESSKVDALQTAALTLISPGLSSLLSSSKDNLLVMVTLGYTGAERCIVTNHDIAPSQLCSVPGVLG